MWDCHDFVRTRVNSQKKKKLQVKKKKSKSLCTFLELQQRHHKLQGERGDTERWSFPGRVKMMMRDLSLYIRRPRVTFFYANETNTFLFDAYTYNTIPKSVNFGYKYWINITNLLLKHKIKKLSL